MKLVGVERASGSYCVLLYLGDMESDYRIIGSLWELRDS